MMVVNEKSGEAYDDLVTEAIHNGEFDEAVIARFKILSGECEP